MATMTDTLPSLNGPVASIVLTQIERAKQRSKRLAVPDFWTSQSHSTIRTQYGVQPFVPFDWQRQFIDSISQREMLLKSRDVGSSEICVRYFCWLMMKEGGNLLIKADKWDNAKNLVSIARQYLSSLPDNERPTLAKDNETEIEMQGIGSIRAMAQGGGRSERCKYLLMTERAFWQNPEEELAAISGALVAGGWEIIESTANGFNEYHALWQDEQNGYHKTFISRHDNPTHNADWWQAKQRQLEGQGQKLLQEYPETANQAFIASGNCVFEVEKIQELQTYCRPPLSTSLNGALKIWVHPQVGRRYVAGADVAEGIDVGNNRLDYSGVAIYDWQTAVHVADLHGQWDVSTFAQHTNTLCRGYNNAFLGVERNNDGKAVLLKLTELEYPSLYWHSDLDEDLRTGKPATRRVAGWPTTVGTRPVMIDTLASLIASGGLMSYDAAFWDECLSFVRHSDGKARHQQGCHDDRVFKHMIALLMRNYMPARSGQGIATGQRFRIKA